MNKNIQPKKIDGQKNKEIEQKYTTQEIDKKKKNETEQKYKTTTKINEKKPVLKSYSISTHDLTSKQ